MLSIYGAVHLYLWWRLAVPLPSPWFQVTTALLPVLGVSFPIGVLRGRRLPRPTRRPLLLVGYMWFGFATYLLLGALASHVAVAAFDLGPQRAAMFSALAALAIVVLGLLTVARGPVVKRVRIPVENLPVAQYTLAHLTDVHIGSLLGREFAERVVRRVNALRPELIAITGDLVDGHLSELRPHIEPLRGLRSRDGVYAVTGNHEYYWNVEPWLQHLRSLGIQLLRNEHIVLPNGLHLAGTDDSSMDEDVPGAVAGRDPRRPLVLLAHHPRTVLHARDAGVDVQLSGHTHGGQLLPWGWLARIWDPQVAGLGRFGRTWLYVSHGTGFWGPPMRVGTRCEIALITLVPAG